MKKFILVLALLAGFAHADFATQAGRQQWGDSLRWGDTDDSSGYILGRGNSIFRDSSGTWRDITTDSCSKALVLGFAAQIPNSKLELSYEVRTSTGNTDSSQIKLRVDSRYCKGIGTGSGLSCESWVPAGRFVGDTSTFVMDTMITVATTGGVTWKPTRQLFDVPGGTQIRLCADGFKDGGALNDSTFFRRFIVRTSSVPAGGIPPASSEAISGALPAGTNHIGSVKVDTIATGTNSIGQVTANAGTNLNTSALALDATVGRAQGSTTSGQTGPIVQGAVTTAAPSYTTAQTSPLSLTTTGDLRVSLATVPSHAVTNAGTFATQSTLQTGANTIGALTANQSVNVAQVNGVTTLMGNGVTGTGSQRVTIASDNTAFSTNATLQAGSNLVGMVDLGYSTRSDTYTTTGNGTTVTFTTTPRKHWAIQATGTGATPTTWDIRLEGSLDGVTFTNIVQHTNVDGQGVTKWSTTTISPCLYFRSRCAAVSLGSATNIVVVILGSD